MEQVIARWIRMALDDHYALGHSCSPQRRPRWPQVFNLDFKNCYCASKAALPAPSVALSIPNGWKHIHRMIRNTLDLDQGSISEH